MAATSILTNIAKLSAYARDDLFTAQHSGLVGILIVAAIVTAVAGKRLLRKLSTEWFERGVVAILAIAALNLLLTSEH
eukprot:UN00748